MNIQQLRNETPGCNYHNHLNNAGAAMQPQPVLDAVNNYLMEEALHGGYEVAAKHAKEIGGFYDATAKLLGANPHQLAYLGNGATDAFNRALMAVPFEPGDVLLTTDDDYVSSQIAFIYLQKKLKIKVLRASKLPTGGVDPDAVKALVQKHHPKLVAVAHVPTNSGLVQDVEAVGKICREAGCWYLVDACQSFGQLPLDVESIGCDFLSATFRKWMRGPRGAGLLYASQRALDAGLQCFPPDMAGGVWVENDQYELENSARRFEYWEKNYAILLGAKAAVEYALNIGLGPISERVGILAAHARQELSEVPGVRVLDKGLRKCGIVTCHLEGKSPDAVRAALTAANVNAGVNTLPSTALIDLREKGVDWFLRISPHYYNTMDEIDEAVSVLKNF